MGDIYAAATDPARWYPMLDRLRTTFDARAAGLRFQGASFHQVWTGLEPDFEAAYVQHYWQTDPWVDVSARCAVGEALASDALLTRTDLMRSEFYAGMCVPFELDDLLGGVIARSEAELVTIGIMKQARGQPFDVESTRELKTLLPHFQRAIAISRRLAAAQSDGEFAWHLIDKLPHSVLIVGGNGRVARTNRAAEQLFGDGLALDLGRLTAVLAPAPLRQQVDAALAGAITASPVAVAIPRPSGRPSYRATVMPIGEHDALLDGIAPPAALVVIVDPAATVDEPSWLLAERFGLTEAETRIAMLVGHGASPREAAALFGVADDTVRFQLRQIYAKTGTTTQAGLTRLLAIVGFER